ncbi:S46 family peptidase [Myxococcota bacterium]|nr:S46 family peptidase [Myxococcota bacterium]MBU1382955.1 S46 family peptidase [Myxococcota bacterium]MBU1495481.1 S46 family peptidase [Myxococcota bacterium]
MKFARLLIPALILLHSFSAFGAEGMYLPEDFSKLKIKGVNAPELAGLKTAVAKVARGGTGSFVSSEGLLVTNHHVAYRCIATLNASEKHRNILKNGFYTADRKMEIPCPGYDLLVIQELVDVTDIINKSFLPRDPLKVKLRKIIRKSEELASACEKKGQYCEVNSFQSGLRWIMSVHMNIRDVRLVYSPSLNVGKFGGDIDNWRYPRHTGDYTFLRAWVSPDGKSADYSKNNVPYKPLKFLKVSTEGFKKDDYLVVAGFPGRTNRFATSVEIDFLMKTEIPTRLAFYKKLLSIIEDPKNAGETLPYEGLKAGLNNATKYYGDLTSSLTKLNLTKLKTAEEEKLEKSLGKTGTKYRNTIKEIEKILKSASTWYTKEIIFSILERLTASTKAAVTLSRWDRYKKIPSVERIDELYRDRNLYRVKGSLKSLEMTSSRRIEIKFLQYLLGELKAKMPNDPLIRKIDAIHKKYMNIMKAEAARRLMTIKDYYRFALVEDWTDDGLLQFLHIAFAKTSIFSWTRLPREFKRTRIQRQQYFDLKAGQLSKVNDPLVEFGLAIDQEIAAHKQKNADFYARLPMDVKSSMIKEYLKPAYYDANFTLRYSYGKVANYTDTSNGKKHPYLTGFSAMLAKYTGKYPFDLSSKVRMLGKQSYLTSSVYDKVIKDIPLNFTTKLDTTGGNSGSPVLNGKGELVGLLFDGTPESIASDYIFGDDQRSICFDIRFAIFLLKHQLKDSVLLKEMNLTPAKI